MDYIAYDPKTGYVWVPAINIGSVDVVDTNNGGVREISGFATKELNTWMLTPVGEKAAKKERK